MENLSVQDTLHCDALTKRLAHIKDTYGNNYPIVFFKPSRETQEKEPFRDLIKENSEIHFFSELKEAFKFVESLDISFILIVSREENEQQVLQSFQRPQCAFNRRMLDFEEKYFLEDLFKGSSDSIRKSLKAFVFATRLDCATGSSVDCEEEEVMVMCDVKDITKEFRQEFDIIWYDPILSSENKEKLEREIEVQIQEKNIYDDFDELWKRIAKDNDVAYHLVFYGKGKAEKILEKLDDFQNLLGFYIYHTDSQTLNLPQDDRVEAVKTFEDLIPKLKEGIRTRSKLRHTFPAFATNFDAWDKSHLYNIHYYLKGLINFKNRTQAKKDFINLARRIYQDREKELIKFESTYCEYNKEEILRWYTKDSPIYRLVNNCLRISSSDSILYCRFALQDLERAIREEYKQKSKEFNGLVYRGAYISADEWEKLQRNTSKAIEMYGFLSTSVKERTAINFVKGDLKNKILITIVIPPLSGLDDQGFAEVSEFSSFPGEKEILFNVRSRFRILETNLYRIDASTKCRHLVLLYGAEALKRYMTEQNPLNKIMFGLPSVMECDICKSQDNLFGFNQGLKAEVQCIDCLRKKSVPENTPLFAIDLEKRGEETEMSFKGQLLPWKSGTSFLYYGYKCYNCQKSEQKKYYRWMALNTKKVVEQCSECFKKDYSTEFNILISEANPYTIWEESETEWEKVDSDYQTEMSKSRQNDQANVYMKVQRFDLCLEFEKKIINAWSRKRCREVEKLDFHFRLGDAYDESGNHQQALEYLLKAREISKNIFQEEHEMTAGIYNRLATIYEALADHKNAQDYFLKVLSICERIFVENHRSTAAAYNNIAAMYQKLGEYQQALEYFKKSLEIKKVTSGERHPETALLYYNIGAVNKDFGNNQQALVDFTEALEIRKAVYGEKHPETAASFNSLGSISQILGDYKKALEYLVKARDIGIAIFGEKHPTLATVFSNIASVYQTLAEYPQALESYMKALDIQMTVYGEKHPNTARSYSGLGNVYTLQGKYKLAFQQHQKALDIRKASYGENHPDIGSSYSGIASVHESSGEYKKALDFNKKALEIYKRTYGEKHAETADSYNKLGFVYGTLDDNRQALENHQKALDIRKAIHWENHPRFVQSYSGIAQVSNNLGDYQKAIAYLKKALEIQRFNFGEQHSETATLYYNLALVNGLLRNDQKALKYHTRSLNIKKVIYDEKHPSVADSYNSLGSVYQNLGEEKKALEYHQKALEIRKFVYPEKHVEILTSYHNIGAVHLTFKDYEQAKTHLIKSLEINKAIFGENSPSSTPICSKLAEAYQKLGQYQKALEYYKKSLGLSRILYSENHPNIALLKKNIATVEREMGETQLAEEYDRKPSNVS